MLNKLFPFKVDPRIAEMSNNLARAIKDNAQAANELREQLRNDKTHLVVIDATLPPKPTIKKRKAA